MARHATICRRESRRVANAARPCKHVEFRCCKDVRPHAPRASSAEVGARETSSIGGYSMFGSRAWSHPCATPEPATPPHRHSQPDFTPRILLRPATQRHARNQRLPCLTSLGQQASYVSKADPPFWKRGVSRDRVPPQTAAVHCAYAFTSSTSNL